MINFVIHLPHFIINSKYNKKAQKQIREEYQLSNNLLTLCY